jgi:hypothetical protein
VHWHPARHRLALPKNCRTAVCLSTGRWLPPKRRPPIGRLDTGSPSSDAPPSHFPERIAEQRFACRLVDGCLRRDDHQLVDWTVVPSTRLAAFPLFRRRTGPRFACRFIDSCLRRDDHRRSTGWRSPSSGAPPFCCSGGKAGQRIACLESPADSEETTNDPGRDAGFRVRRSAFSRSRFSRRKARTPIGWTVPWLQRANRISPEGGTPSLRCRHGVQES